MNSHKIEGAVEATLEGTTALTIAAKAAVHLYQKFVGDAYSSDDVQRLKNLKQLYQQTLESKETPVVWELDDKNCPTHHIEPRNWSLYCKQIVQGKNSIGNYHYQSRNVAEYAATYLEERGKRKTGSGKRGDLLEQFLGELINFALNDLPTYDFDEISIKKIQQRIKYLEEVKKSDLFKFGTITRQKNKYDVIESIHQQLKSCLALASQEVLRRCARDKFDACHTDSQALLLSCVQTLYYSRETDVHYEPLELQQFVQPSHKFQTTAAKSIYPTVKNTHTGEMLHDVICLAGLDSFGIPSAEAKLSASTYFDKQFKLLKIDWKSKRSDLPPWVDSKNIPTTLVEFQQFSQSILRVAQLKQLIDKAYDLTGKVGDIWAYGDITGKKSLSALLFLMDAELDKLKQLFDALYKYNNEQRQAYNLEHKLNAKDGVNPNFTKVDTQKEYVDRYYNSLKNSIKLIREQMQKFPENAQQEINQKKREFYRGLMQYFQAFYPDRVHEYNFLDESLLEVKEEGVAVSGQENESRFVLPIKSHENGYCYFEAEEFKSFSPSNSQDEKLTPKQLNWQMGKNYDDWMRGFFNRQTKQYTSYQQSAKEFQRLLKSSSSIKEVKEKEIEFLVSINTIKLTIENERPKWRFHLSLWPIKTAGWPFNKQANKFAECLLNRIQLVEKAIQPAMQIAEKRISQIIHEEKIPVKRSLSSESTSTTVITSGISGEYNPDIVKRILEDNERINKKAESYIEHEHLKQAKKIIPGEFKKFINKLNDIATKNHNTSGAILEIFSSAEEFSATLSMLLTYRKLLKPQEFTIYLRICNGYKDRLTKNFKGGIHLNMIISLLKLVTQVEIAERDVLQCKAEANKTFQEMQDKELSSYDRQIIKTAISSR